MKEMSFVEHLEELKKAVIKILIILAVAFALCYALSDHICEFLLSPLRIAFKETSAGEIVYLGLLDKIISQLQVALWSAVVLSSPLWFREIWQFVKPGLFQREIKTIRPFFLVGLLLFWIGIFFAYFVVFPMAFQILMDYGVGGVKATIGLRDYLVLSSKALLFFGLAFQLPNILLILGLMGLVSKQSLREMRRYIYVAFAIAAAILTPPDVFSMLAVWFPMVMLFEVGILAVALIVRPQAVQEAQSQEV